ncbi:MAG: outer membrane porin GjpA, partial [Mycobacterium sp.]
MQAHLDAVLTGFTLQNSGAFEIGGDNVTTLVAQHTLTGTDDTVTPIVFGHDLLFAILPALLPADEAATVTPIVDFLASPLSGIIMGALGPFLSPGVALINSISAGDSFEQILASPLNGLLNGATINLDSLIPTLEKLLPPSPLGPLDITSLDFGLGGLLSPGVVM